MLRRGLAAPGQILGDCRGGDIVTEQVQFGPNTGNAPGGIILGEAADYSVRRPRLRQRDRFFWICLSRWLSGWQTWLAIHADPTTSIDLNGASSLSIRAKHLAHRLQRPVKMYILGIFSKIYLIWQNILYIFKIKIYPDYSF
jgi:hypothetical protein